MSVDPLFPWRDVFQFLVIESLEVLNSREDSLILVFFSPFGVLLFWPEKQDEQEKSAW